MSAVDRVFEAVSVLSDEERAVLLRRLAEEKKEEKVSGDEPEVIDIKGLEGRISSPISYSQLEELAVEFGARPSKQKPGQKGAKIVKLLSKSRAKFVFPAGMVHEAIVAHQEGKPLYPPGFLDAILNGKYEQ